MTNPIQPIVLVDGVQRFKANAIVEWLLDNGGLTLNDIARQPFSNDDHQQFAQLIGYSVSGYSGLSYVTEDNMQIVDRIASGVENQLQARVDALQGQLDSLRESIREPMAQLFGVHPDDLKACSEGDQP